MTTVYPALSHSSRSRRPLAVVLRPDRRRRQGLPTKQKFEVTYKAEYGQDWYAYGDDNQNWDYAEQCIVGLGANGSLRVPRADQEEGRLAARGREEGRHLRAGAGRGLALPQGHPGPAAAGGLWLHRLRRAGEPAGLRLGDAAVGPARQPARVPEHHRRQGLRHHRRPPREGEGADRASSSPSARSSAPRRARSAASPSCPRRSSSTASRTRSRARRATTSSARRRTRPRASPSTR